MDNTKLNCVKLMKLSDAPLKSNKLQELLLSSVSLYLLFSYFKYNQHYKVDIQCYLHAECLSNYNKMKAVTQLTLQFYLHDSVPVVSSRDSEQGEERHAEVLERGVSAQTFTRILLRAFWDKEGRTVITPFLTSEYICRGGILTGQRRN